MVQPPKISWNILLTVSTLTLSGFAQLCFEGRQTYWRCCVMANLNLAPHCTGNFTHQCCKAEGTVKTLEAKALSGEHASYFGFIQCWARGSFAQAGFMFARNRCCGTPQRECFDEEFTYSRCCAGVPRLTLEKDMGKDTFALFKVGQMRGLTCYGNPSNIATCHPEVQQQGLVLYCGPHLARLAHDLITIAGALHYRVQMKYEDIGIEGIPVMLARCYRFYENQVKEVPEDKVVELEAVMLLSPMIENFHIFPTGHALHSAKVMLLEEPDVGVVGMPAIDNKTWAWPIYKIKHAYWKMSFLREPLGYGFWLKGVGEARHCYGGDTTSGTRVYKTATLKRLLSSGPSAELLGSGWLPHLDLKLKDAGGFAMTCLTKWNAILQEPSYLRYATLEPAFSDAHAVEAAKFHIDVAEQYKCKENVTSDDAVVQNIDGLAVSICIRKGLKEAVRLLKDVWEGLREHKRRRKSVFIVPLFGTGLSFLRMGAWSEHLPWDADADLLLVSPYLNRTIFFDRLKDKGFEVVLKQEARSPLQCADEKHLDLIWRSPWGVISIDIWLTACPFFTSTDPWSTGKLGEIPIDINTAVLSWLRAYFDKWDVPGSARWESKAQNGFKCKYPGHNACIDQLLEPRSYGSAILGDEFAHVDRWS